MTPTSRSNSNLRLVLVAPSLLTRKSSDRPSIFGGLRTSLHSTLPLTSPRHSQSLSYLNYHLSPPHLAFYHHYAYRRSKIYSNLWSPVSIQTRTQPPVNLTATASTNMCHYIVGRYKSCEHCQGPTLALCELAIRKHGASIQNGASSVRPSQNSSLNSGARRSDYLQTQQPESNPAYPHKYDTRYRPKQPTPTNPPEPCWPHNMMPNAEVQYIGLCPMCIEAQIQDRCVRGGAKNKRKKYRKRLDLGRAMASDDMAIKAAWYRLALAQSRYIESCFEEVDEIEEEEDRFMLVQGESPKAEAKRRERRTACLRAVTRAAVAAWKWEIEEQGPYYDVGPSLINRSLFEGYIWDYKGDETDNSQGLIEVGRTNDPQKLLGCDCAQMRGGAENEEQSSKTGKSEYSEFSWPWIRKSNAVGSDTDARKDSSMTGNEVNTTGTLPEKDFGEGHSTGEQKGKEAITETEKDEAKESPAVGHEDATTNTDPNRPDSAYYWGPASKNYFPPGKNPVSEEFRQNSNIKKPVAGKFVEHLPQNMNQPDSETQGSEGTAAGNAPDTEERSTDVTTSSKTNAPKSPKGKVSSIVRHLSDKANQRKSGSHDPMPGASSSTAGEPSESGQKGNSPESLRGPQIPKSPKSPRSPSSQSLMRRLSDKISKPKSIPIPPVPQNTVGDAQQPKLSSSASGPVSSMIRRLSDKMKRPKVTSSDPVPTTTTCVSAKAPQLEKPETATSAFPSTSSSVSDSPKAPSPAEIRKEASAIAEGPPQLAKPDTSTAAFPSTSPPGPASPVPPVPSPPPPPPEPANQSEGSETQIDEGPIVQRWPKSTGTTSTVSGGPSAGSGASEGQADNSAETASFASGSSSGSVRRSGLSILFKRP
ncbi:hypothetical protein IWZ00DRAFT_489099 [Phyllosticta capitalensis]